jgi:hypothetical protein
MSRKNKNTGWRRTMRHLDAPNLKRWYKDFVHKRNRRAAKQNPNSIDKKLDPWAID